MAAPNSSLAIDPAAAQKAFTAILPRLLDLKPDELLTARLDLQKAAIAAVGVGRMVQAPKVRARFHNLPVKEFHQTYVDDLETIALAAFHANVELLRASAKSTEAKLPVSLVLHATAVKQRLLRLLECHFGDDPTDGPEIADIKLGMGYADLAYDLLRLAKLYEKRCTDDKLAPKRYLATDATDARSYAQEILHILDEAKHEDEKTWTDLVNRCLTLLVQVYGVVSAAGRWLYRKEDGAARFPPLYVMARPIIGRAWKEKAAGILSRPGGQPS
jgi:hypothetical protein